MSPASGPLAPDEAGRRMLTAGRELDVLVAEKVMGWRRRFGAFVDDQWSDDAVILLPFEPGKYPKEPVYTDAPITVVSPVTPRFSTDIADAWTVVERLLGDGCRVTCRVADGGARVEIDTPFLHPRMFSATAVSAPLAICRAAIAVVEVQNGA